MDENDPGFAFGNETTIDRCTPVSRGRFARVDRIETDHGVFARKRFAPFGRKAWAREVASHLVLPLAEVAELIAYGTTRNHCGWLMTRWYDWPNVRTLLRGQTNDARAAGQGLVDAFQQRLRELGYRWNDPAVRNVICPGPALEKFRIVDFALRPLREPDPIDVCIESVLGMPPGCTCQARDRSVGRRSDRPPPDT